MSDLVYRREIDGLRALAVILVVLFHAGVRPFSGGYVGVDIFFVLSGHLITTVILADIDRGSFSFVSFYERRARRILPALFLVLAACLPFAWWWLLPSDLEGFSRSLVAVCLFVSNFFFNASSNYFETATDLKPLLHTWSLAVEEQYYLLFPLVFVLALRSSRRWTLFGIAALLTLSLALAQWGSTTHVGFTYFLLPTRAWELLLGSLTAFHLRRERSAFAALAPTSGESRLRLAQAGSLLGLTMILSAALNFDHDTPFPSLYALLPTVGAVLVILFATPRTLVGRALATRPMVGMGLISYGLYLWHQPLFAFARHRSIDLPGTGLLLALACCALGLAYLSWRFVETPFRNSSQVGRKQVLWMSGAGCALFIVLGIAGIRAHGFVSREPYFSSLNKVRTIADSRCHNGWRRTAAQIAQGDVCTLGQADDVSFAVIGDSHAAALFEALGDASKAQGKTFFAASGGYCVPLLNGFRIGKTQDKDCAELTRAAFDHVLASSHIRDVVLVAEWASYTKGWRDDGFGVDQQAALAHDDAGASRTVADNAVLFERSFTVTVSKLLQAGKHVVVVGPVPEFRRNVLSTMAKQVIFHSPLEPPTISLQEFNSRNAEVFDAFAHLANVEVVATQDLFCTEGVCHSADPAGEPWYSDTNHLTEEGARRVALELMQHIGSVQARH